MLGCVIVENVNTRCLEIHQSKNGRIVMVSTVMQNDRNFSVEKYNKAVFEDFHSGKFEL
jgi:hypothetical protein